MESEKQGKRAWVSEIITALIKLKEEHGDMRFFAALPPNLHDNDYHVGVRKHKETGVKEAFIETIPNMPHMLKGLDRLMDDMGIGDALAEGLVNRPSMPEAPKPKVTCEFNISENKIAASDGKTYFYRHGGCGEAIYIDDVFHNELSVIPSSVENSYQLHDEDKEVICAVINGLKKNPATGQAGRLG